MLRYVYGYDKLVANTVAQMVPHCRERGFGKCRAIGVIDESNRLIAGMVYHNWYPEAGTIDITAAAITPRWLSRRTLAVLYGYPFLRLRCQMITQCVPAENKRLLWQLKRGGFTLTYIARLFGRDRDGVVCTLTDDDWASNRFNKHAAHVHSSPMAEAA